MTETYWTAFEIADRKSEGRSRSQRHRAFIEVVSDIASTAVWTETPHFLMFDSHEGIDSIKDRFTSAIDESIDLFVLVGALSRTGCVVGAIRDDDIFKLMPSLEMG